MPPAKRPDHYLTPEQERIVRRALIAGATRREAAALIGITRQRLDTRMRDQLADLRVGRGRGGGRQWPHSQQYSGGDWDINEAEIARRAAEIRATWSEEMANDRRLYFSGPIDDVIV